MILVRLEKLDEARLDQSGAASYLVNLHSVDACAPGLSTAGDRCPNCAGIVKHARLRDTEKMARVLEDLRPYQMR